MNAKHDDPSHQLPIGPSLHPRLRWRRWLYLLRHVRCAAARDQFWEQICVTLRSRLARRWPSTAPGACLSPLPTCAKDWLQPGDLILNSGADLLQRIRSALADSAAPVIVYQADAAHLAAAACHPVETVWLLEQHCYRVYLLTAQGVQIRPIGWHDWRPSTPDASLPWLLAAPPARQAHFAQLLETEP